MNKYTFNVPGDGCRIAGQLCCCEHCGAKTLVQRGVNGTDHDLFVNVMCLGCVDMVKMRETNPDVADKVQSWKDRPC